jgi:acetolactate synthase-1/2/3 large subunit
MPEKVKVRTKNRGADVMVETLKMNDLKQIMAVTGGAIMEGMDALGSSPDLSLQIFQTEGGACWSAMGCAKVTGKAGICAVTSGPGATNTATPISDTLRDNVPRNYRTGPFLRTQYRRLSRNKHYRDCRTYSEEGLLPSVLSQK